MALNGFIVLMNCKTWMRNKCLPTGDKIVTSLCLSRLIYQCIVGVHSILNIIFSQINLRYLSPARIVTNYISIWVASLLCVYYCVKIANYKHVVFLYLKERMSKLAPWFLGLCVICSLALSVQYMLRLSPSQAGTNQNATKQTIPRTYYVGSSLPLVIFAIAFFLTVPSLWKHIRNMSGVGASFRNPDMKTHYNAIKSIAFFFLLHTFFIVCVNFDLSGMLKHGSVYKSLVSMLIMVYPCVHSAVIIFYNRKLRRGFLGLLTCGLRSGQ
ncbi:taste receptor type 2 member 40-like [Mantella aurantiaca]